MQLKYGPWFKDLEKLIAKFNNRDTNPMERFAALSAIRNQFKRELEGLESEIPRYERLAIEEISK